METEIQVQKGQIYVLTFIGRYKKIYETIGHIGKYMNMYEKIQKNIQKNIKNKETMFWHEIQILCSKTHFV